MSSLPRWKFVKTVWSLCLVLTLALSVQAQQATGIAIVKARPEQSDEFARAILFQRVQRFGVVSNFHVGAEQPLVVQNNCVAAVVTFDSWLGRDLTEQVHLVQLSEKRSQLVLLTQKHPAAAAPLQSMIADLGSLIQQMQSGMVRFRGGWMSSQQYRRLQAEALAAEEKREEMREEQKAAEKAKREAQLAAEKAQQEKAMAEKEAARLAKEAKVRAEKEDLEERERQVKSRPSHMAALNQLQKYQEFTHWLKVKTQSESRGSEVQSLREGNAASVKLPKVQELDVRMSHGVSYDSYSLLTWEKNGTNLGMRVTMPLRGEDGLLDNEPELRELLEHLRREQPQIGEWLPTAVASAHIQLALQKHRSRMKRPALVTREIAGLKCELQISQPELHEDGSTYHLLNLSIF